MPFSLDRPSTFIPVFGSVRALREVLWGLFLFSRAVVLESGLETFYLLSLTCLGLLGIWTRDLSRTWSFDSPNVLVGLNRVQQYMLFVLFQSKTVNLARLFRK